MIFDTIYSFFYDIFSSNDDVSEFWANWQVEIYSGSMEGFITSSGADYFSALCTVIVIVLGVFALFRILGGILKLFKV